MRAQLANSLSDRLLTQDEVCAVFGVSRKTVQRWRKVGRISFARFGHRTIRIKQSEVLELVRESDATGWEYQIAQTQSQIEKLKSFLRLLKKEKKRKMFAQNKALQKSVRESQVG